MKEKAKAGPAKGRAMLGSYASGLLFVLILFALACFLVEQGRLEELLAVRYLHLALLTVVAYSAYWMRFGWVRMVEGEYLHAEYGGTGNLLQRIIFRDRQPWQLSQPLPLPLDLRRKDGCVLYVSVWENFLGRNRVMFRMINMYTGENADPWDDQDGCY